MLKNNNLAKTSISEAIKHTAFYDEGVKNPNPSHEVKRNP